MCDTNSVHFFARSFPSIAASCVCSAHLTNLTLKFIAPCFIKFIFKCHAILVKCVSEIQLFPLLAFVLA